MAKKVVVAPEDEENGGEKKKKKRSWCCTCCLMLLAVCFVLNAAILGVGWYFGDKYSKQYFDMSLTDVFGVVNGMYWANDDFIEKPFDKDKDLDGFYGEIKKNVLLKTDAPIDFDAALEKAIVGYLEKGEAQSASVLRKMSDGSGDGTGDVNGENTDSDVMGILVDMVADVFTRENIDVEKLAAYSETTDEYVLELKDTYLAAFVQSVIDVMLKNADKIEGVSQYADVIDLGRIAALKQISFKNVSERNELGENVVTATTADVTLWLGLQDAAGQALTYYIDGAGYGWASGIARFVGNAILPKNLYVTLSIPLQGDADVNVTLNDMTPEKRDRLYKLINGVMALGGGSSEGEPQTVQAMLNGIGDQIKPLLEQLTDTTGDIFGTSGEIKLDLIDILAKSASENMETEEALTKPDFMYMLQAVLTSDPAARRDQLKQYLYAGWYKDSSGRLAYRPADTTGYTAVDYGKEFVKEIERKYSLSFGDDATLDDVLQALGMTPGDDQSSGNGLDIDSLLDKISKDNFDASLHVDDIKTLDVAITDRMLAAALSTQLDKLLGETGSLEGLQLTLDALTFVKGEGDQANRTFALVAVTVDISQMLGDLAGDDKMMSLVTNVLPEELMLTVTVDVTPGSNEADYVPTSFMLNDYENTERVLGTLAKVVPSLDLTEMTGGVEGTLREMLENLTDTIGITLSPSVKQESGEVTNGSLNLPNIFELVSRTALKKEGEDPVLGAQQLRLVLRGLVDTDGISASNIADDYNGFIADVVDKYYLNVDPSTIDSFEKLAENISGGEGFDASKFRVGTTGTLDPDRAYMIYDTRSASELAPVMSAGELGALVAGNLTGEKRESFDIHRVETTASTLKITLSIKVGDMLPPEVQKLMSLDTIYAVATVHLDEEIDTASGGKAYKVDFNLNSMTETQLADTLKLVRFFADGFDISEQVGQVGSIMHDQLGSLEAGFGGAGFFKFTNAGLELKGFYDFLASNIEELKNSTASAENIKGAIQGLYPVSADLDSVFYDKTKTYNYDANTFIVNPSSLSEWQAPDFSGSDIGSMLTGITSTDAQFNGFFQQALNNGGMIGTISEQTIVLANGNGSSAAKNVRTWIAEHSDFAIDAVGATGDYFVVTASLSIKKSTDESSPSALDGFIPGKLYATIVIKKNDTGEKRFTCEAVIFNNLNVDSYNVVTKLMGLNADASSDGKVNIKTLVDTCLDSINGKNTQDSWLNNCDLTFKTHDHAKDAEGTQPTDCTAIGDILIKPKLPSVGV